eukprot:gene5990-9988_t
MQRQTSLIVKILTFFVQFSFIAAQFQVSQCLDITPTLSSTFYSTQTTVNIVLQFSKDISVTRNFGETKDIFSDFASELLLLNYLNQKVEISSYNIPSEAAVYLSSGSTTIHKPTTLQRFSRNKVLFGFSSLPLAPEFSLVVSNSFKVGSYENEFTSRWTVSRTNVITTKKSTTADFCIPTPYNNTGISPSTLSKNSTVKNEIIYEEASEKITFKTNFNEFYTENFTFEDEFYELVKPLRVTPALKEDSFVSDVKFTQYTAPVFEIAQAHRDSVTNLPFERIVSESFVQSLLDGFLGSSTSFFIRDTSFKFKEYYTFPLGSIWRVLNAKDLVINIPWWFDYMGEMTFSNGEKIRIVSEHVNGRSYRLWKIVYLSMQNGKTCPTGSLRNSECPTCSKVYHAWMSDNSKIFEVMNISSTVHTQSSAFNIEVSNQKYSVTSSMNSIHSMNGKLSISVLDSDVEQTINLLKNDQIIIPARSNINENVPISNFVFVNRKFFSEEKINSIGTGPKVWNNAIQQEFCSLPQGTGLKNQLSYFLQNWDQQNIGRFSGYYNRFLLNDVQFAKNPNCLGDECVDHQLKIQFSKLQTSSVSMNVTVDRTFIGFKEPKIQIGELKMKVNSIRQFENHAQIFANITNSGELSGDFTIFLNCTNNIIFSGDPIQKMLKSNESTSIEYSISTTSKIDSNETCSIIVSIQKKKLWSSNLKNINKEMKIQIYDGYLMELPEFCFGKNSSDSTVCSSHGNCIDENNCTCSNGYTGNECQYPFCFGMNSTDPDVCSKRGICNQPDSCNCSFGYVGSSCEYISCFGKNSSSNSVCSSHGTCISPNKCSCTSGYTGNDCETPICFSKNGSDPNVCSGNGICSSPNKCSCDIDFTGNDCQLPICFGKNSTDPDVCSRNGNCLSPNSCSCKPGFTGQSCELNICFGTNSNEKTVCSSHGNCISPNTCKCSAGYTGKTCQLAICFGLNSIDSNVCSGNGECSSPDKCDCKPSYSGNQCQFTECFNKNSSNSMVCSGNGNCLSLNNCSCSEGYFGSECSNTTCQGILSSNSSVCSGKGVCQKLDQCLCDNGFNGTNCEICDNVQELSLLIPFDVSRNKIDSLVVKTANTQARNIDISIATQCTGISLINSTKICSNITTGNECILESNFKLLNQISSQFLDSNCTTNSTYTKKVFDSCFEDGSKFVRTETNINLCQLVDAEYLANFKENISTNVVSQKSTENLKLLIKSVFVSNKTAIFNFQLSNTKQIAHFHPILNCSTDKVSKPKIGSFIHKTGNYSIQLELETLLEEYECSLSFFVEPSACWKNEEDQYFIKFAVPKIKTGSIVGFEAEWMLVATPFGIIFLLVLCFIILVPLLIILLFRGKKGMRMFKTISSRNLKTNFSFLNAPCEWCENFPAKYLLQLKKGNEIKLAKICGGPNCFYKHMRIGVEDIEKIKSLETQKEISVDDFMVKKMKFHEDVLLTKSKQFEIPKESVKQDQTPPVQSMKMSTEFYIDPKFSIDEYQV